MSTSPNYASTPNVGQAVLTAAMGGTRAAPTGGATVFTPGANGSQVERFVVQSTGSVVAGTVLFYRVKAGVYYPYAELTLTPNAYTAGTAQPNQTMEAVSNPNLFPVSMPNGYTLYAVLSVAQAGGISIQVEGGDF